MDLDIPDVEPKILPISLVREKEENKNAETEDDKYIFLR